MQGIGSLGGHIATQVRDCTHLVAEKVARTEKFLSALSLGKHIVHKKWLSESAAAGEWQGRYGLLVNEFDFPCSTFAASSDEAKYPLIDEEMEGRFEFSLTESTARARRKKLLDGYTVYATPHVQPDGEIMARIVEAAGGNVSNDSNHYGKPTCALIIKPPQSFFESSPNELLRKC